ncbi:MAG: hypothetical protein HC896_15730, partial [Bacteroidales bacterium]|nr:hypothetical protein [Bacteroidales bacterium]
LLIAKNVKYSTENIRVINYETTGDGRLWAGSEDGLHVVDIESFTETRKYGKDQLATQDPLVQHTQHIGTDLWAVTQTPYLYRLDLRTNDLHRYLHDITDPYSISKTFVWPILKDNTGTCWLRSEDYGLNYVAFDKIKFSIISQSPLAENTMYGSEIRGLYAYGNKYVVIGSSAGLFIYYRDTEKLVRYEIEGVEKNAVYMPTENEVWVGTGTLYRYIIDHKAETSALLDRYDPDPENPQALPGYYITYIFEDSKGNTWLTCLNGLAKVIGNKRGKGELKFKSYQHDPNDTTTLAGKLAWLCYADSKGQMWVTTANGLSKMDTATGICRNYRHDANNPHSISTNNPKCVTEDIEGNIWVGTEGGGLCKYLPEKDGFKTFTVDDGLPSYSVYGICTDEKGHLWMSTKKGICEFNPKTETFTTYGTSDGLQDMEYSIQSYYKNKLTKEILFGGALGINIFNPADIKKSSYQPKMLFTDFRIDNDHVPVGSKWRNGRTILDEPIWDTDTLILKNSENTIYLSFATLDYADPKTYATNTG